jgi:glycosyltransferase involved in cell wall biosynthesis
MATGLRLSVAIPIHNEESVLPELLSRLRAALDGIAGREHEIVFVDDGSTDQTFEILKEAAANDDRIVVLSLSRNFGHQAAISAALDHVTGDAVVVMDGDLQDIPEVIPQFVEKYQQGYDVVYAKRVRRKEPLALRICYYVFYRYDRADDVCEKTLAATHGEKLWLPLRIRKEQTTLLSSSCPQKTRLRHRRLRARFCCCAPNAGVVGHLQKIKAARCEAFPVRIVERNTNRR